MNLKELDELEKHLIKQANDIKVALTSKGIKKWLRYQFVELKEKRRQLLNKILTKS